MLDHILWRMRQEVLAPRMMEAALTSLATALGAEGAAVLDMLGDGSRPGVLYQTGSALGSVLATALGLLGSGSDRAAGRRWRPTGGGCWPAPARPASPSRPGWRCGAAPAAGTGTTRSGCWPSSATGIVRMILDHDSIQREMARQARTDPLTGLLNRRAFMEELARRLDRLDREGLPGTLMFVDLDHFKQLNDARGHETGDAALCAIAALLRDTVRPADLVARLGGDEFALWLDGADDFSAAERAEHLRSRGAARAGRR